MLRAVAASLLCLAAGIGFSGCSSSAAGIDECRTIEYARCSAGQYCDLRIDSSGKLTECEHFARDNCLHGLASGETPHPSDVSHCLAAIKASGTCAHRQGSDTLATDCEALVGSFASARTTVCDVVQDPENASECAFLTDKPVVPDAGPPASTDAGTD